MERSSGTPIDLLSSSKRNPGLCEFCEKIFENRFSHHNLISSSGVGYRRRLSCMLGTALDGCALCRELLCMPFGMKWAKSWKSNPVNVRELYGRYDTCGTSRQWPISQWRSKFHKLSNKSLLSLFLILVTALRDPVLCFYIRGNVVSQHTIKVTRCCLLRCARSLDFTISTPFDDAAAKHIRSRSINYNVKCDTTFEKIRQWLRTCDLEHPACRQYYNSTATMPTLLLDVNSNEIEPNVRLERNVDANMVYAALSYCWGGPQERATTGPNYPAYLKSIDLQTLPQTLQDAVFVTRKLGLKYLWVDSLCIIQDSEKHKVHEIGKMERIYSNAYVTISASSAKNCHEGFLESREPRKRPLTITIPFTCENGDIGSVLLVPCDHKRSKESEYKPAPQPVDHRAWAFQENFLSRRILLFTDRQLFWVCSETWGKDGGRLAKKDFSGFEMSCRSLKIPSHSDWTDIIEQYSTKLLTDPDDKLPALSSIAAYFARTLNDKYLAGLWARNLHYQICWIPFGNVRRCRNYRAPSWSFLALEGGVKFKHKSRVLKFKSWVGTNTLTCDFIDYRAIPHSNEAPFGRILSASLRVRGWLVKCKPGWGTYYREGDSAHTGYCLYSIVTNPKERRYEYGKLWYDAMKESSKACPKGMWPSCVATNYGSSDPTESVWCLFLCMEKHALHITSILVGHKNGNYTAWYPWGLALAKLSDGSYHRVGYFEGNKELILRFTRQSPEIITIV